MTTARTTASCHSGRGRCDGGATALREPRAVKPWRAADLLSRRPASDSGIDGESVVELDELDLIVLDPLPPYVWFQDMTDFAEGISDLEAGRDLTQSLKGRGAFRRFKNQLCDHHPELIPSWHALRDVRAQRRAVQWLLDHELIDDRAAEEFVTRHPDPDLP